MSEQTPYPTERSPETFEPELALNPEPRLACVLLLDVSHSMSGSPIAQLNEGLRVYKDELVADSLALKRVEVAIVTFGGAVQRVCDYTIAENFQPPALRAGGDTPMGAALNHAMDILHQRKGMYKMQGLAYFRPWIFMITDGAPTDDGKLPPLSGIKDESRQEGVRLLCSRRRGSQSSTSSNRFLSESHSSCKGCSSAICSRCGCRRHNGPFPIPRRASRGPSNCLHQAGPPLISNWNPRPCGSCFIRAVPGTSCSKELPSLATGRSLPRPSCTFWR